MKYYIIKESDMVDIADAIRAKRGTNELLSVDQMKTEIPDITTDSSADYVRYVTFRNESTGEEFVKSVAIGDDCVDVVANGLWPTPTRESDAQYDYTFYGWGASDDGAADADILKNVTADKTVYAIYTKTVKYYTITYYDEDGTTVLHSESLPYGIKPSYVPTKDGYILGGWTPALSTVTEDARYAATWVEVVVGGSCGTSVNWAYDAETTTLTISGTGKMSDYAYNTFPWYEYRSQITNVIINEGITHIAKCAFYMCSAITAVALPDSVTSIGGSAFYGCSTLPSITIPEGVTSIGVGAFESCGKLTSFTVPAGVTVIEGYTFYNCYSLTSFTIPDQITSIGASAFYLCMALESVEIPSGVTFIGKQAFKRCDSLVSATFKETSGWWYADSNTATSGTTIGSYYFKTAAITAKSLTTTYADKYWFRS